jgi:hypothetical protein
MAAFATRAARADYRGPDENMSQAYGPLQGALTYSATLNQGGGNPDDQDWYYFYVPAAGDKLHWTVSNTTALTGCTPLGPYYCNVYATLVDSGGKQVGGDGSSAGTSGVGPSSTQSIDWTFKTPGKYYLAITGDGDQLSYQFSVTPGSGVSSTPPVGGGGGSQPRTSSLRLKAHQDGRDVDVSLVVPSSGAHLDAHLYTGAGRSLQTAGGKTLKHLPAGSLHFAVELNSRGWAALKKHHRLTLTLRVTVTPVSGKVMQAFQKVIVTHRR